MPRKSVLARLAGSERGVKIGRRCVEKLMQVGALSLGGVAGVNARYWLGLWVNRWVSPPFPWATFLINTTGSFLIGLLTMLLAQWLPHPHVRLLVVTGFLGGYTTYSTFAFESLTLWERGERGVGLAYVGATVVVGLLAVALGVALARSLTIPRAERATRNDAQIDAEAEAEAGAEAPPPFPREGRAQ
jgi:CrcB protein